MPVEPISDPTLKIKPSFKLIDFLATKVALSKDLPAAIVELKKAGRKERSNVLLGLKDIKWLEQYLRQRRDDSRFTDKVYLHELLEGIDVQLPKPNVTPRNPELEARIKKLTAQQEARAYEAMTKSVDSTRRRLPDDTIASQIKQINRQLVAVAQFVFSVLAGFAFGFIGIELLVGNLDFGFRLLLGIICALVIALAEIYFLAIKLNEDVYETIKVTPYKKMHQE